MTLDLAPLEQAAAQAGVPGLRARLVPPDPRRGTWFRWEGTDLQVSERVVERLGPGDAGALLVNAVLLRRRRRGLRAALIGGGVALAVALLLVFLLLPSALTWLGPLLVLASVAVLAMGWSRSVLDADDDTVRLLGEAETFVRALNSMDQDRLEIGGRRVPVRPDLHRRAERLVTRHQLRLPPERRTVSGDGDA